MAESLKSERNLDRSRDPEKFLGICSECKKEVMFPFQPNPNKPSFCRECHLASIEITPDHIKELIKHLEFQKFFPQAIILHNIFIAGHKIELFKKDIRNLDEALQVMSALRVINLDQYLKLMDMLGKFKGRE